jgi:hypothetical protein
MWPAPTAYYWEAHARHPHSSRSSRTGYILCRTTGGPAPFSGETPGICSGHYLLTQSQTSAGKTASAVNFRWGAASGEFARRENHRGSCVSPWERYHPGAGPNALSDVGDARMAAALPLYRFVREQPDCAGNKSPIFSGSDRRGLSLALHPLGVHASGGKSADKPVSLRRAFKLAYLRAQTVTSVTNGYQCSCTMIRPEPSHEETQLSRLAHQRRQ